jgi:hypothetical protein
LQNLVEEMPPRKAGCYSEKLMSLPFAPKRFRAYEIEFGAGGQRLGCKFLLDDGSLLFVGESEITSNSLNLIGSSPNYDATRPDVPWRVYASKW